MRVAISASIGLAIAVLALPAQARQAPSPSRTVLADLRQETGETSTRLVIAGSAKPSFTHHSPDPLTLVVDIADADPTRLPARLEVATREVESLRVSSLARGDGKTAARIEVRLAAVAPFTVEEVGNDVVITVARATVTKSASSTEPAALPAPPARAGAAKPSSPKTTAVSNSEEPAPKGTRISGVTRLGNDQVGYHVDGNGTLKPETFFLKNPSRLVVDFPDVVTARSQALPAAVGPVKGLRLAQFSAAPPRVARLVLDVDGAAPYHLVPDATGVSIIFGAGVPPAPAVMGAPPKAAEVEAPTPVVHREPVSLESPEPAQTATATGPAAMKDSAAKPVLRPEPIAQSSTVSSSSDVPKFTGHPISLDFKDGDIIDLFRLMSEISGLNIIVNPGVSGKVSLTVKEVPWDQALDLILKTQGLGYTLDGNVVRIARVADLQKEEQEARNLKKEKELSGAQTSWKGTLSYIDTDQVKAVVEKTVLSDKGTFLTLGSGNVFIVTDLPDRVAAAQRLVADLDRPVAQVDIEARIVISERNYARALGIQWGFLNQQTVKYGNTTDRTFPNSIILNGQGQGAGSVLGENLATANGIGQAGRGYMVNLPVGSNTGIGLSMGNILGSFNLDAALSAAESTGKIKTVSSPRITAQNKVAAKISQGTQIPYQTVSNGTVTTTFKDATLSLNVTPTINDAGTVLLKVDVNNDSPGTESSGGVTINTQSVSTTVLVKDGGTTVLGGVYAGQESFSRENTPFLSQIPVLGMLFKNKQVKNKNYELLIFITPRIVR